LGGNISQSEISHIATDCKSDNKKYEVTTDMPGLTHSNIRVSLSFKLHGSRSLGLTLRITYGASYANGFRFDSHHADFRCFFLYFFSGLRVTFKG